MPIFMGIHMLDHRRACRLLLSSSALGLALWALPAAAHEADPAATAPVAADAADQGLTDIVVTAEKRPESLQKTPISISVMKSDDLANRHVTSLLDLGDGAIPRCAWRLSSPVPRR
jgi:iron complex outermembrane receptor protein